MNREAFQQQLRKHSKEALIRLVDSYGIGPNDHVLHELRRYEVEVELDRIRQQDCVLSAEIAKLSREFGSLSGIEALENLQQYIVLTDKQNKLWKRQHRLWGRFVDGAEI